MGLSAVVAGHADNVSAYVRQYRTIMMMFGKHTRQALFSRPVRLHRTVGQGRGLIIEIDESIGAYCVNEAMVSDDSVTFSCWLATAINTRLSGL